MSFPTTTTAAPAPKWTVCPNCDGEGWFSKIGAFTAADVDEWYGDDQDDRDEFVAEYTRRGGAYDEACPICQGQRVVATADLAEIEEALEEAAGAAALRRAESPWEW